ncbi:MAG: hypothetical protein ACTSRZ_14020 [Promethearchaeota archaeon]
MQGLMLVSFKKSPGAYIEFEYPKNLHKKLGWDEADVNVPYSVLRMRNMKPMFGYLTIHERMVAAFYSGFDFKDYVGHPNKCLYLILDNENPAKYEDILVHLSVDILSLYKEIDPEYTPYDLNSDEYKQKKEEFWKFFVKKYHELEEGKIEPLSLEEAEIIVDDGSKIATTDGIHRGKVPSKDSREELKNKELEEKEKEKKAKEIEEQIEDVSKKIEDEISKLDEMEKEDLRNEIRRLQDILKEKDEKIYALESKIKEMFFPQEVDNKIEPTIDSKAATVATEKLKAFESKFAEENKKLKQKITELSKIIDSKEKELNNWCEKVAELNEKSFIQQDTISKMTEMTIQQAEELQQQARKIKSLNEELKKRDEVIKELTSKNNLLEDEIQKLKDKITEMQMQIENQKEKEREIAAKIAENALTTTTEASSKAESEAATKTKRIAPIINELNQIIEQEKAEKQKYQLKLGEYKSEIIELKKTIKIQRREIQSLEKRIEILEKLRNKELDKG